MARQPRVGFDAHMVGEQETGNETYALGLLHGLAEIGFPVHTYAFRPLEVSDHRQHRIGPRASSLRIPLSLPAAAFRDRLDLLHTTYVRPPVLPCASVVTVHDITFALYPEWFEPRVQAMLNRLVPLSMRRAQRIITISQQTKRDIVDRYGISPDKIAVTYLAPRPAFAVPGKAERNERFFLYAGNVAPRKNVETLVRAMVLLRDRGYEVPLLIAGKPGLRYEAVLQLVHNMGLGSLVRCLGYVPDEQLRRLYASCVALLHPALYEGFGLTPLEAMAQGAPVLASNTSSLPEVVEDAGILLPADDPDAWADSMAQVLGDQGLRDKLAERGRVRAQSFSWRRCAEETVAVYRAALPGSREID